MQTPFDQLVSEIATRGFHNHRLEEHSSIVSRGILRDLTQSCEPFQRDIESGVIRDWLDFPSPGGRARKLDLVVAELAPGGDQPDLEALRLCIENKSVITAHRNRTNRYDDLDDVRSVLHARRPEAVLIATVLIGVAERVLNVPDRVKPFVDDFDQRVLPRLSSGDETLWSEFPKAISSNRHRDAQKTVEKFRQLPLREPGHTHHAAYDYVLLVPVFIDNVHPPLVARENDLGIEVDAEYERMLTTACRAYTARWHT